MTSQAIVARAFRGSQLFLAMYSPVNLTFCWTADRAKAHKFDSTAAALAIADRAAREYRADCVALDVTGTALQPAAARAVSVASVRPMRKPAKSRKPRCADCGAIGETVGHQTCAYPGRVSERA